MNTVIPHATHDTQTATPHAAAQSGIQEWHRIVADSDWEKLSDLLADDVVFRNPSTFEPYQGKGPMQAILPAVFSVLEDFKYLRHFGSAAGYVLEFSASIGDEQVMGVDLVEFNDDGKIIDFMVMMRPASVVLTLSAEVGKRIAAQASAK